MGKSIGIISLKGGVGKTSSVVSLGAAIASLNQKVLLVDGNFSAPNLGMHLKLIDPKYVLNQVLEGVENISKVIQSLGVFDVLPAAIFGKKVSNPFKLKDKLKTIKDNYDFVLIDSSPALNDETLATMLASDEIFVVTTPDYPTLSMTIKAINLAKQRGTKIDGLILNKVYGGDFELSLKEIEAATEVPVLAVIPHDEDVLEAVSNFTPYTLHKPNSEGSKEYFKLAEMLSGKRSVPSFWKNFFRFIIPKQEVNRDLFYTRMIMDPVGQ